MNVLFVNRMMGVAWGGGENFDFQLAKGLASQGHQVTFLTAATIRGNKSAFLFQQQTSCFVGSNGDSRRQIPFKLGLKSPQFAHLLAELVRVPLQSTGMDDGSTQQGL